MDSDFKETVEQQENCNRYGLVGRRKALRGSLCAHYHYPTPLVNVLPSAHKRLPLGPTASPGLMVSPQFLSEMKASPYVLTAAIYHQGRALACGTPGLAVPPSSQCVVV